MILLAIIIYLGWEVWRRGVYQYTTGIYPIDDADEWRYTACSRLVEHGYTMFHQVFSAQPPLLFLSLAQGMALLGDSIAGARWVEIAFGLLGLLSAAWIGWIIAGPVAGGAAALLLAVSPGYLVYSHAVEAEGPMMALMTLSLALALTYARIGSRLLPALVGLSLAAAVLMKLFAIEALAPAIWIILSRRDDGQHNVRALVTFLLAAAVPVLAELALVYPAQQWDQVVRLHQRVAAAYLPGLTPPLQVVGQFLALDLGLSLLAASGLAVLVVLRRRAEAGFLGLWLGGSLIMLLAFRPLFPHHPAILLTSLGVCAGIAVGELFELVRNVRVAVPVVAALLCYGVLLPRLAHDDRHLLYGGVSPRVSALAAYVRARTAPAQFVATDDLAVADRAHRLVPPPLCDPSNVRLRAGYLTAEDLISSTRRYHTALVLPSFGIYEQVAGYLAWLAQHYRREPAPDGVTAFLQSQ